MSRSTNRLYKIFIYLVLSLLAISIIVPVGWVFLASLKENSEFYRSPWSLPMGLYWQNFVDAWNRASMGAYVFNSVVVTAMALALLLALVYAATSLPFTIYLLSSYFMTLPSTFEEAASIDGANHFTTMMRIMIPMAKPSIITVILFNFLGFWNEYIISFTLMNKQELRTLPVGLMNLMAAQNAAQQYGQLYAGMVMVMLPTLILYIFVQKRLTEGMTAGGSKE